jgi:hypothetical protein
MVGVGVYFCRSRCKVTDSIQEVADITFAEYKQSAHYWFIPADSAALTPEPRLVPPPPIATQSPWGEGWSGLKFVLELS